MATQLSWQENVLPGTEARIWEGFVGAGAALVLLGMLAAANLLLATFAVTYMVGVMMLAGGILQLCHAFGLRHWSSATLWALSGLFYVAAAVAVMADPLSAAGLLTLALGVTLGVSGLARAGIAIGWQGADSGWMLVSGLVSIAVATVIALGWPANALWLLGLLLVIDLVTQGAMLALTGFTLRAAGSER